MKPIRTVANNPDFKSLAWFIPNIRFTAEDDLPLYLQLLVPQVAPESHERFPLIVFIQGSAWTKPVNLPSSFLRMSTPQTTSIQVTRLVLCTH